MQLISKSNGKRAAGGICLAIAATFSQIARADDAGTKGLVTDLFAAFNRHDAAAIADLYTDDVVLTSTGFCSPRKGRSEAMRTYQALFDAMPDVVDIVEDEVASDDRVAVRFVGRHAVNGKMTDVLQVAVFMTVRDGKFATVTTVHDTAGRPCAK